MSRITQSVRWPQRFWMQVNKAGRLMRPELGNCWEWIGAYKNAYGSVSIKGKRELVHRASWRLHFGEIPEGMRILHKCDYVRCVRPDHLFMGTQADNMQDCSRKGRMYNGDRRGCKHPMATLNDDQLLIVRTTDFSVRGSKTRLAERFGVDPHVIYRITNGVSYKTASQG